MFDGKKHEKKEFKIQILAGNPVNSWFSAGSQISSTLVWVCNLNVTFTWIKFEISGKSDQLKFMLGYTYYLGACKYLPT